jgi:CheY-like chemotaxis protein
MPDRNRGLVVVDDADVRSLLGAVLARNHLTVAEAASSAAAMTLLGRAESCS